MKAKIILGAIMSISLISGCASSPKPKWQKAGISQNDTKSAMQKCNYQLGLNKISDERKQSLFKSCMESEGYRYTSKRIK